MTIEWGGHDISLVAAEDMSGMQYMFVHQADNDTCDRLDSAAEHALGVLQNAPEIGEVAVIRVTGTSKLVMNDAVAVGVLIKPEYVGATDNGKGDAADTNLDNVRGLCIHASGAEDDVGGVLLSVATLAST